MVRRRYKGNMILIGFMGCGKTSVGTRLSYRMKKPLVDLDKVIERQEGRSIKEIFETDGEPYFRAKETSVLQNLAYTMHHKVFSTGGGTPLRDENKKLLREIGTVVYLRATADTIYSRVKYDTTRPLLQKEDPYAEIVKLLEARKADYEACADLIIDVDGLSADEVIDKLFELTARPSYRNNEFPNTAAENRLSAYSNRLSGMGASYGSGLTATMSIPDVALENQEQTPEGASSQHAQNVADSLRAVMEQAKRDRALAAKSQEAPAEKDAEKSEQAAREQVVREQAAREQVALTQAAEATPSYIRGSVPAASASSEVKLTPKRLPKKILVINGPNLNFLGIREKSVYGNQDYQYLLDMIAKKADETGSEISVFQSNYEGGIIDRLQAAYFDGTQAVVINPGAYTHYSYAIHDALKSVFVPKVEIHISDITAREAFRRISVTAAACDKQIYGQGLDGYLQAIDYCLAALEQA